jgi:translation initiation factor 2 alpha subunit (eIF-2alpha)
MVTQSERVRRIWPSEKRISALMRILAEDLYREVPEKRELGYAMENPLGNVRIAFWPVDEQVVAAEATVNGRIETTNDADKDWLERVAP